LASSRRLRFIAANAVATFATHLTLTYRARTESWESDAGRNRRIIQRSFADRHRFMRGLREEIGEYLWVREFQARGVVHYHVLCERAVSQERATAAWCRASGQLDDAEVVRHGVKADAVRSQQGALSYLGRYLGKERQKELPAGVEGAGRWWGRSRSLRLATLDEILWFDHAERVRRPVELRIVRILRRFISKRFGRRYWGGAQRATARHGRDPARVLRDEGERAELHGGTSCALGGRRACGMAGAVGWSFSERWVGGGGSRSWKLKWRH
jgi:hypothetical protein